MSIHPTAIIDSTAKIGKDVEIGPFSIVEADVVVGDGCVFEGHVAIKQGTTLGKGNRVFEGAVIGGMPQHVNMPEKPGSVLIGDNNTLREGLTIHRALEQNAVTTIGDNNLLMVNSHVAHDCEIGNNVIATNNALIGGHVIIEDRAYISGAVAVHQFCRIGALAMVGGQAHVVQDVPPFVTVDGLSSLVVGLNKVGLRRAGFKLDEVRQLKEAYRLLYRKSLPWNDLLAVLKEQFAGTVAARFYEFISETKRGIVSERRMPPGATIKLRHEEDQEEQLLRVRVG